MLFFFFKQKTAYDMRISDWSSDVCSSDLIGVLVVIVMDSLPGACEKGHLEHPVAVQDPAMESIPDQRIKQDGNDNRSYRRNRWSGIIDPDRRCHSRQCQISDECRILKISDDQISQRHPIQMMRAFPEARSFDVSGFHVLTSLSVLRPIARLIYSRPIVSQ